MTEPTTHDNPPTDTTPQTGDTPMSEPAANRRRGGPTAEGRPVRATDHDRYPNDPAVVAEREQLYADAARRRAEEEEARRRDEHDNDDGRDGDAGQRYMNNGQDRDNVYNLHGNGEPISAGTWSPLNLREHLDADPPPPPQYLTRTDGHALFYADAIHWVAGEPESGKSWVAFCAASEAIRNGHKVMLLDFEDQPGPVIERFRGLGLNDDQITSQVLYANPTEPLFDRHGETTAVGLGWMMFLADLRDNDPPALTVIDGVTDSLNIHGIDANDNRDVADWVDRVPRQISRALGCSVVLCDHVTKSTDGRGRWAIGAQHKMAAVDGAAYTVEAVRPIGRAYDKPLEGMSRLRLQKDKRGHLRGLGVGRGDPIAELHVTTYPDGGVSWDLKPPDPDGAGGIDDPKLQARILGHLMHYEGASTRNIEQSITGRADDLRAQTNRLIERGYVTVDKVGQAHAHTITEAGRDWMKQDDE